VANTTLTLAQKKFVQGYIIDMSNVKTMAEIQDQDWESLPNSLTFKTNSDQIKTVSIDSLYGFSVEQLCKYSRQVLDFDKFYTQDYLPSAMQANPDFQKKEIWIKTLIEGNISLYEFNEALKKYYYYSVDSGKTILPLVYRQYETNNITNENNQFRRTLAKEMGITDGSNSIFTCPYKGDSLIDFIIKYNAQFTTNNQVIYQEKKNFNRFNGNLKMGLAMSNFLVENAPNYVSGTTSAAGTADASSTYLKFRPSFELEVNFSTKYKKWSFLAETVYVDYTSNFSVGENNFNIDYKSINLVTGFKRYFTILHKAMYIQSGLVFELYNMSKSFSQSFNNNQLYSKPIFPNAFSVCSTLGIHLTPELFFEFRYDFKNQPIFDLGNMQISYFSNYVSAAIFSVGYKVF
jgi:hypothetical protein